MNQHLRRCLSVVFTFLVGNSFILRLVGVVNKKLLGSKIQNVFLLYPAHPKYASAYVYDWHRRMIKWSPALVGCYYQEGKFGLTFGISATEEDYKAEQNQSFLRGLEQKMESIRMTIGAETKTYAGILPSILNSRGFRHEDTEKLNTIALVHKALRLVEESQGLTGKTPVVVLGGRGYIGTDLLNQVDLKHWIAIDQQDQASFSSIVAQFSGQPLILLNLTRQGILHGYIPLLWSQCVVLNEVYPEPSLQELEMLRDKKVLCYHIVGVRAKAWPAFPRAYQGGIPCCAALNTSAGDLILKLLT